MIPFKRLSLAEKENYESILFRVPERSCEYSFANLFLWGRQQVAFLHGCAAFFSHFEGRSVYPYPIGPGDRKAVVEEILLDARERGIPCRLVSLNEADRQELENWFPGKFLFREDRDSFDYVYDINDLADLAGKKLQKKRNHINRFLSANPDYQLLPLDPCHLGPAMEMVNEWFRSRIRSDTQHSYLLESIAMARGFRHYEKLGFEGAALMVGGEIAAVTMATRLSEAVFDVHFEKAREDIDGAYTAVNREFARYLRGKHPEVKYLNREDDMGLDGLRRAKLSYCPHHMAQKHWAIAREEIDND